MDLSSRLVPLLARACPPHVVSSFAGPDSELEPLFPEEAAALAHAVPRRRWEFRAGRHCARRALAALGLPASPILVGEHRAPRFPLGVLGSITHTSPPIPVALALATRADRYGGLGVDLERRGGTATLERELIASPPELAARPTVLPPGLHLDLLFSAKEAAYKALYPWVRRQLGFDEVAVEFTATTFSCRLLVPTASALREVGGSWAADDTFVLCVATIDPSPPIPGQGTKAA